MYAYNHSKGIFWSILGCFEAKVKQGERVIATVSGCTKQQAEANALTLVMALNATMPTADIMHRATRKRTTRQKPQLFGHTLNQISFLAVRGLTVRPVRQKMLAEDAEMMGEYAYKYYLMHKGKVVGETVPAPSNDAGWMVSRDQLRDIVNQGMHFLHQRDMAEAPAGLINLNLGVIV